MVLFKRNGYHEIVLKLILVQDWAMNKGSTSVHVNVYVYGPAIFEGPFHFRGPSFRFFRSVFFYAAINSWILDNTLNCIIITQMTDIRIVFQRLLIKSCLIKGHSKLAITLTLKYLSNQKTVSNKKSRREHNVA